MFLYWKSNTAYRKNGNWIPPVIRSASEMKAGFLLYALKYYVVLANHISLPLELGTTFLLCRDGHRNSQDCQGSCHATHMEPNYQVGMVP